MGIYISEMEMPKNCETCELSSTDSSGFFGCCVTGNIVMRKREQDRPSWCPLIELPPHGDLIDRDAFDERIRIAGGLADEELSDDFKDGIQTTLLMLKTQRTIIESEGEDGN